jgi:hypothetical protein
MAVCSLYRFGTVLNTQRHKRKRKEKRQKSATEARACAWGLSVAFCSASSWVFSRSIETNYSNSRAALGAARSGQVGAFWAIFTYTKDLPAQNGARNLLLHCSLAHAPCVSLRSDGQALICAGVRRGSMRAGSVARFRTYRVHLSRQRCPRR